jgi:hypothetical protein
MSDETKTVADVKALGADIAKARADVELEFAKVKLFWAKYGHPALYALVSAASAYLGHKL